MFGNQNEHPKLFSPDLQAARGVRTPTGLPIKAQGRESASAPWVSGSKRDLNPEGVTDGDSSP
jgi:hypothetical protein